MASTLNADNGVVSGSAGLKSSADSTGVLALQTNGTTAVTIDTSQNVGIGTSAPTKKLVVSDGGAIGFEVSPNDGGLGDTRIFAFNRATTSYTNLAVQGQEIKITTGTGATQTERMRIDSSGNVGIGTSSPDSKLNVYGAGVRTRISDGTNILTMGLWDGATNRYESSGRDMYFIQYGASNKIVWATNASDRMTLDSSGNLLLGTSAAASAAFTLVSGSEKISIRDSGAASGKRWRLTCDANNTMYIINQSTVGVYMADGGSSWIAISDERLKTALKPFENAADKVCSLRVGTGRYLTDEESVSRSFLIAQDVQAVLPEAVNIQDDEIGTMGLAYTDTIPLLVAAIQEQQALINNLTERLTALEGAQA